MAVKAGAGEQAWVEGDQVHFRFQFHLELVAFPPASEALVLKPVNKRQSSIKSSVLSCNRVSNSSFSSFRSALFNFSIWLTSWEFATMGPGSWKSWMRIIQATAASDWERDRETSPDLRRENDPLTQYCADHQDANNAKYVNCGWVRDTGHKNFSRNGLICV